VALKQPEVDLLVREAFEQGINFFDTANVYSLGESETLLGQAFKNIGLPRDEIVVATKSTGIMNESPNGRGQSRFHIYNEVDASLRRLQLDHIDLYQLHGFDPLTPIEESLSALRRPRQVRKNPLHRTMQHGGMAGHESPGGFQSPPLERVRQRAGLLLHRGARYRA